MSKSKDRKSVREFDGGLEYGEVLDRRANFSAGLRVIKDYKGSEYNDLIKEWTIGNGDLWRQFWCIFGKLLYYYYVKKLQMFRSLDLAGCVCDYVPYMTDGERFSSNELDIRVKLSERGLDMIRKELYDTLSNIVRIARDESLLNEEDILGQLREYHFRFMLYGLGFFMSFPLKDGEYFSVRFKGLIFSEWLWWLYESIDEDSRVFVRGVMRNWAVDAFREGLDARILAFTNRACVAHNAAVHAALFPGSCGFAVGEQVIAQDGFVMRGKEEAIQVRTSELLTVVDIEPARHEASPDIPAWRVTLENESGRKGAVWVAQSRQKLDELISRLFSAWRCLKQAAENEDKATRQGSLAAAKAASQDAWALRNRYANLRHAYALTIHKSQGSTFDAVLIDWGSLPNNGGADASRLAYVAITRPSTYAVIVTP